MDASRRGALAMLMVGLPALARGATSFRDAGRFVFVPSADQPSVTVIDAEAHRVVGSLHLGLVPHQAMASRSEAVLIATDGRSAGFVTIDLASAVTGRVELPHAAERLVMGANGWLMAAVDLAGGVITIHDLRHGTIMGRIAGLPRIHDVMFVDVDGYLFVAAHGWTDVAVFDVNTSALVARVGAFGAELVSLARMPNGEHVLVQPLSNDPPGIIHVATRTIVGQLGRVAASDGIVPSGTGKFVFVPDNSGAALRMYRQGQPAPAATMDGAPGMGAIYSAWLDSVAFVTCASRRQLLSYDLDTLRPTHALDLAGVPGQGGVTPDSATLFVPLSAPPALAVIDAQSRRVAATIDLPAPPLAAVVPGGWGLCH